MRNKGRLGGKESIWSRYMKAPIRFLCKARDFYVRGITECSAQLSYGIGCPTGQPSTLPRSFSVGSATSSTPRDDYRELIRAASVRSYGNRVVFDPQPTAVPRSRSVAIGRINEHKASDFGHDIKASDVGHDIKAKLHLYSRSRSYALHRRTGLF